jgi:hypothetical protein
MFNLLRLRAGLQRVSTRGDDLLREWPRVKFAVANPRQSLLGEIAKARPSHALWSSGVHPPASLGGEYLRRWNGHAGIVAYGSIQGPLARRGQSLLWVEDPGKPSLVEVRPGSGCVIVSQLEFRERWRWRAWRACPSPPPSASPTPPARSASRSWGRSRRCRDARRWRSSREVDSR